VLWSCARPAAAAAADFCGGLLNRLAGSRWVWRLTGTLATVHRNCAGDGANDLAMIDAAGLGIAFCAKPNVQATVGYWSTINVHRLDAALYFLGIRPKDLPPHSPHSKPTGLKR
jgi:hypothetical protein